MKRRSGPSLVVTLALTVTVALGHAAIALDFEPLSAAKLRQLKKRPCTFVHVWASWCGPCVEELPSLLQALPSFAPLAPLVIDVSPPRLQATQSRALLERIQPSFRLYRKIEGNEAAFFDALDPKWPGALPYSALYDGGKKRKEWVGPVNFRELRRAVDTMCRISRA